MPYVAKRPRERDNGQHKKAKYQYTCATCRTPKNGPASRCQQCRPYCEHVVRDASCSGCAMTSWCMHGKKTNECQKCRNLCIHGRDRETCSEKDCMLIGADSQPRRARKKEAVPPSLSPVSLGIDLNGTSVNFRFFHQTSSHRPKEQQKEKK